MRVSVGIFALGFMVAAGVGCGDDKFNDLNWNNTSHDGGHQDSGTLDASVVDSGPRDVAVLPDRTIDPEGPTITILEPTSGEVLSGNQVRVVATVVDDDGVDTSTVKAIIPGGDEFVLSRTGLVPDEFSGLVDLQSIPSGSTAIMVEAADTNGALSAQVVQLVRDAGPTVDFVTPEEGARYKGSVILAFFVLDPQGVQENSVSASIGQVDLELTKTSEDTQISGHPNWIRFQTEIVFNDTTMFDPTLRGLQWITVQATNIDHGVEGSSSVSFTVDEEGPTIDILTPTPGQILGGVIEVSADIQDEALVSDPSVVAVLAHNNDEYEIPLTSTGGGAYRGSFDSRQFPHTWVFPSLSVRAADQLGNESESGFLVALDNTPPIASLDPPDSFRLSRRDAYFQLVASQELDPVGPGVPNDGERVPQVFFLRARIEDQGNRAGGLLQQPIALVDQSSVRLYVLSHASSRALLVDTNDDGFCDEINPELIPTTIPQTENEVLALTMEAITPAGTVDYRDASPLLLPPAGYIWGESVTPPDDLCFITEAEGWWHNRDWGLSPEDEYLRTKYMTFTRAIFYTLNLQEPAIYALPPVLSSDPQSCAGHQFDALANAVTTGWACVAVRAVDQVGNVGVSMPLRIYVDNGWDPNDTAYTPPPTEVPNCTGTWNPISQTVNTGQPCGFDAASQAFPENEIRREDP